MIRRRIQATGLKRLLGISIAILLSSPAIAQQPTDNPVVISDKYSDLHPEQKRLVDDWFRRFSDLVKRQVSPEEGYNNLPVSAKTTFSGVTHALLRTPLTDESGASLGNSAVTLVDKIDQVLGQVEGTRGDRQFRIYVELKPGAMEILEKSQEFGRENDNTVYHKGFPICFRSPGTPSIQVSISRDGKRADIDVDYRSSKFPVALINGHLSSSNSDIRAGNNDERHNDRWTGVSNWWRSLLGLPLIGGSQPEEEPVPINTPRTKANAKPVVAVHDFLQTWLVDRAPDKVVSYFTDAALSCMELEQGRPIDRGLARFSMLIGLRKINETIGTITDLSQAVVAATVDKPQQLRVIDHPYKSQFVLYDVREDLAERFNCAHRLDPLLISAKAASSTSFGKYVGAVFYLKSPQVPRGETVATLWAKQDDYWRLISYATEPDGDNTRNANLSTPIVAPPLASDAGDKQLTSAARDFYQKWFVRRRVDEAFRYLSTRAYACVNLYRSDDVPEPASSAEAGQLIQRGMENAANFAGSVKKLEEAIVAPDPSHPDLKLVKHGDSEAFAMVAIPDSMAAQADCSTMKPGQKLNRGITDSSSKSYGQYYATGFHLKKAVEEPGVLWIVWAKENDQWKIVAYHILTP
jgi:hypothetical protein